MTRFWVVLGATMLLVGVGACVSDETTDAPETGKGVEDEPLQDAGKADSFFKPTEHGTLSLGVANQATITEDARFHAWEIEVDEPGKIAVQTDLGTANLDTVMYLYFRKTSEERWGRFIKKNDDFQGEIWSRIERDVEPGQYRVIVKAFKKGMRGSFSVMAECEGCKTIVDGGECSADSFSSSPVETGYGNSCAGKVLDVLSAPVTSESGFSVTLEDRCGLGPEEIAAIDFYHEYWDDLIGWDDFVFDGEESEVNVESRVHGESGTWVSVDIGADEDTLIFVFDAKGELLMFFHDEQSPTAAFHCGESGDSDADFPDEGCVATALYMLPHGASDAELETGRTTGVKAGDELSVLGAVAASHFVDTAGLSAEDEFTFAITQWEDGAEVTLSADETSATYYVANLFGDPMLVLRRDDAGTSFLCKEVAP